MESRIVYRRYKRSDYAALTSIVQKTWNYDRFASKKTADKMARVFLNTCLANQTFTNVAEVDGIPVGVIMGSNIKNQKTTLRDRTRMGFSAVSLMRAKEGSDVTEIFRDINHYVKDFVLSCQTEYEGEVTFFAVGPEYRRKGIGKMLFRSMISYMGTENIHDIYLYADSGCNYKFFENQGMTKRCEKNYSFESKGNKEQFTFYIYDFRR